MSDFMGHLGVTHHMSADAWRLATVAVAVIDQPQAVPAVERALLDLLKTEDVNAAVRRIEDLVPSRETMRRLLAGSLATTAGEAPGA